MRIESKDPTGLRRGLRVAVAAALVTTALAPAAHADWTKDILDARCEEEQRERMGENIRDSVEASVRRAEASIQAPTPLGDLSCLDDLMTIPIDTFSGIGSIVGNLTSGLMESATSIASNLDFDIAGAICGMAAEKWATLTTGLGASALNFNDFKTMSANPLDRLADNTRIDTLSYSGAQSNSNTSEPAGRIENWQQPSTAPSELLSSIPLFPEYVEQPVDAVAMQRIEDEAWAAKMAEVSAYIGCRVAANLDGAVTGNYDNDGRWGNFRTNPDAQDCTLETIYTPVFIEQSGSGYQSIVPTGVHSATPAAASTTPVGSSASTTPAPAPAAQSASPDAASVPAGTGFMSPTTSGDNAVWQSIVQ